MPKYRKDNRMLTIEGETKPLWQWAEESGVDPHTIRDRLRRGRMSLEEAVFFKPRRYKKQPKTDGQSQVQTAVEKPHVQTTNIPGVQVERTNPRPAG